MSYAGRLRYFGIALALALGCRGHAAGAQPDGRADGAGKLLVVALTDDPKLRAAFEDGVVAKVGGHGLLLVASHDIVRDVRDVDGRGFLGDLDARRLAGVLLLRPAPLGPHSSLTSVRAAITPDILRDFGAFAKRVSHIGPRDAPAVVHIGVYLLEGGAASLLTAGATWLDTDAGSRAEAAGRLESLVALNLERAAPAIREALDARHPR